MENEKDENTARSLDNADVLIIFILTSVSFVIRYWRISLPPTTVFDEVYFGNFTNYYIQSQFYYDIHPPLAKILMFYIANLSEYDGSMSFKFNSSGYPLPDYVQLRLTPATFSALVFPLIYLTMRFSSFSHIPSLCSALLALFDTSLATEGRHILTDGILHFFTILHVAVLSFTLSLKPKKRICRKFFLWHVLTGITLGCACSCKNTAWGLTVFDAFCYMLQFTDIISIKNYRFKRKIQQIKKKNEENNKFNDDKTLSNKNDKEMNDENDSKIVNENDSKIVNENNSKSFNENDSKIVNENYSKSVDDSSEQNILLMKKQTSEMNVSSPLEIQSSIQSSIINVIDGFQEEFNDCDFIEKEGMGGDLIDYFYDVFLFGFTLALIGLFVYCITFYVHFILLPFAGKGTGFLEPEMKKQLISNKCATCKKTSVTRRRNQIMKANYDESSEECINSALYGARVKGPSLFMRTFILTFRMHSGNMRIVGFHDSQSFPWNWPILSSVSTYFWGMNGKEIRCIGNAIVYYLILFALIMVTFYVICRSIYIYNRNRFNLKNASRFNLKFLLAKFFNFFASLEDNEDAPFDAFCNQKWLIALRFVVGYSVSYFPFYWIPRTLYLYHYLIPLIFGCLSFGSMIELFFPVKYGSVIVVFACIAAAFGFWLWSPYVYGTDKHDQAMMIWTRRWIDGDEQHKKAKIENNLKKKK